jgi:hypothetical protein
MVGFATYSTFEKIGKLKKLKQNMTILRLPILINRLSFNDSLFILGAN